MNKTIATIALDLAAKGCPFPVAETIATAIAAGEIKSLTVNKEA